MNFLLTSLQRIREEKFPAPTISPQTATSIPCLLVWCGMGGDPVGDGGREPVVWKDKSRMFLHIEPTWFPHELGDPSLLSSFPSPCVVHVCESGGVVPST